MYQQIDDLLVGRWSFVADRRSPPKYTTIQHDCRWVDWTDRNSCILFGDGAGAMVLAATESEAESGVLGFAMHSDGTGQGDLNLQFAEDSAQSPPSIAGTRGRGAVGWLLGRWLAMTAWADLID